ncbi:hypothetical protein DZS_49460 [Dickeya ananatis]
MLGIGFTMVIVIGFLVAIYGQLQLRQLGTDIQTLSKKRITNLLLIQEYKDNLNIAARVIRNIVLLSEPQQMAVEKQRLDNMVPRNDEIIATLRNAATTPEQKALIAQLDQNRPIYEEALKKALDKGLANKDDEARELIITDVRRAQDSLFKVIDTMLAYQKKRHRRDSGQFAISGCQRRCHHALAGGIDYPHR